MLELQNISKDLGGKTILDGVSLKVNRGETLVIVGPSGTGKSVTLQHMVGLLRPDQGRVLVNGEDIHAVPGRDQERLRGIFGMLFQSGALINWLTVFENVALPLYEKTQLGDGEIRDLVQRKLEMVGLSGQGHKYPAEISGGMKKRAGLARAIVHDPQILLYDEPTSGLDPVMSRIIDRLIRELQRELKVASVVVTHDLQSAVTVGDRIAMLYEGRIIEDATPKAFMASRQPFVRDFIEAQFGRAAAPAA